MFWRIFSALGLVALSVADLGCATTRRNVRDAEHGLTVVFLADVDATKGAGIEPVIAALNHALNGRFSWRSNVRMSPLTIADAVAIVEECHGVRSAVCFLALADQNRARWVLVPEIAVKGPGVTVALVMFDANTSRSVSEAHRDFDDVRAASGGVANLVDVLARQSRK